MKGKRIIGWVNVYDEGSHYSFGNLYPSKKEADESEGGSRVACAKIEFEVKKVFEYGFR